MENNTQNNNYENNIRLSDGKVEVIFLPIWAGCLLSAAGVMTLAGILTIFFLIPETGYVRAFLGTFICIFAILFFGYHLLIILSVVMSGNPLFIVENGELKGKKSSVRIDRIKEIKWRGSAMRYLLIRTMDNKKVKLSTYNLVNEETVNLVIDRYVIPHANHEFKVNWEKGREQREAKANRANVTK